MKTKLAVSCLAVIVLLLAAATAAAAPNQVLVRHVLAGGGGRIGDGATLMLSNTIGEPLAGPLAVTGGYAGATGFWPGTAGGEQLYLPAITRAE